MSRAASFLKHTILYKFEREGTGLSIFVFQAADGATEQLKQALLETHALITSDHEEDLLKLKVNLHTSNTLFKLSYSPPPPPPPNNNNNNNNNNKTKNNFLFICYAS